jgi:hypothetical protein
MDQVAAGYSQVSINDGFKAVAIADAQGYVGSHESIITTAITLSLVAPYGSAGATWTPITGSPLLAIPGISSPASP